MGKVFPKAPYRNEIAGLSEKTMKTKVGVPNRITIRKMFDAERKELTDYNRVDKLSPVNIR